MKTYLAGRGFTVNDNALGIIRICDDWYSTREIIDFHVRENLNSIVTHIDRLGFAKRCCGDDANLCEVIAVTPEEEKLAEYIEEFLENNRFDVMYREQLEKVSATGTAGAYIQLKGSDYMQKADGTITVQGGQIKIIYVDAENIIPLTVENHLVTECAFASTNLIRGQERTTLVIFTQNEAGKYMAETVIFDDKGNKTDYTSINLGEVKPFSIMTTAEVNNIDNMEGYGLPKIYNSIPFFKAIDLCYALLYGDLAKGEKLVFINELLACIAVDENGQAQLTPQQKEIFVLLGKELPTESSIVQEYNPEIRIEQITKAFELVLSLVSMQYGYGTKKYSFENGQITTATEYIGEKQDEMQELNKQRKVATDYINDIVHAALWFANTFQGQNFEQDAELTVEFDDSFIEDKGTNLERMRNDALSFPEIEQLKIQYFMEAYTLTEEEALEWVHGSEAADDEEPGEDIAI